MKKESLNIKKETSGEQSGVFSFVNCINIRTESINPEINLGRCCWFSKTKDSNTKEVNL